MSESKSIKIDKKYVDGPLDPNITPQTVRGNSIKLKPTDTSYGVLNSNSESARMLVFSLIFVGSVVVFLLTGSLILGVFFMLAASFPIWIFG